MLSRIRGISLRQGGVTASEYALIIAVVALIMLVGAKLLGTNLNTVFNTVAGDI